MYVKHFKNKLRAVIGAVTAALITLLPFNMLNPTAEAPSTDISDKFTYFEDSFDRTDRDINGDNGWISVSRIIGNSHVIENGALKAEDFKYTGNYSGNGACTAVTKRPSSEAAVNQLVTADILNLNKLSNYACANLHLRVMPSAGVNSSGVEKPSDSYCLAVSKTAVRIMRTDGEAITSYHITDSAEYTHISGHSYRAQFKAVGTNPTVLTARLYDITDGLSLVAELRRRTARQLCRARERQA